MSDQEIADRYYIKYGTDIPRCPTELKTHRGWYDESAKKDRLQNPERIYDLVPTDVPRD